MADDRVGDQHWHIVGIEDGIMAVLRRELWQNPKDEADRENPAKYAREVTSYAGELDTGTVREALSKVSNSRMPLFLVGYGDGTSVPFPGEQQPAEFGAPRILRHTCSFVVMCIDNDARGGQEQLRGSLVNPGALRMVGDAAWHLGGLTLYRRPEPEAPAVKLNVSPLTHRVNEYVGRLGHVTAYAVVFDTVFKFEEMDRREELIEVDDLILTVAPFADSTQRRSAERPGVHRKVNER